MCERLRAQSQGSGDAIAPPAQHREHLGAVQNCFSSNWELLAGDGLVW